MMNKTMLAATAVALGLGAIAAEPASAEITTFATFSAETADNVYLLNASPTGQSANVTFYSISSAHSTTPGAVPIKFSYIDEGNYFDNLISGVTASLTFNASETGTPATSAAGYVIQPGFTGSFTILTTAPITVGSTTYLTGSNLLSGSFSGAGLAGALHSTSGGFDANNENVGSTITYTSDFVSFVSGASEDASFSLSSILPALGVVSSSYAVKSFKADAGGSFSADPVPTVNSVPEPASWALMMVGFGIAGASVRRRARLQAAA